jgi:hypothetical protein
MLPFLLLVQNSSWLEIPIRRRLLFLRDYDAWFQGVNRRPTKIIGKS